MQQCNCTEPKEQLVKGRLVNDYRDQDGREEFWKDGVGNILCDIPYIGFISSRRIKIV